MGVYLNPGNDAFAISVNDDIYVDKSSLISFVNSRIGKRKRFICVSRPRRFGKSMAAEMLSAYYDRKSNSGELFQNLEIAHDETYEKHLNQYNVIFLNIQQFLRKAGKPGNLVHYIEEKVLTEVREEYSDWVAPKETSLPDALERIYQKEEGWKKGFVFIVDEWDCIFRVAKEDTEAQAVYLDFLRDLFKDRTYVKVAYMTGILPIKKYGTHSALNIFDEFSMTAPGKLAKYVGFTEAEVRQLCKDYGMRFTDAKKWYDGYRFKSIPHIYNPKSIVDAMSEEEFRSYWTGTETYEALQIYIDLDMDGLKQAVISMLSGSAIQIDIGAFQNDMTSFKSKDDVLTLLVHLGYLAYDEAEQSVFIPNEEVRNEFIRAVKNGNRPELVKAISLLALDGETLLEVHMKDRKIAKAAFCVAGIRKTTEWAGGVWSIVKTDGSMEKMQEIAGRDKVTLGLCFGFDEKGYNDNMVGFITDLQELEGYEVYQYPESDWIELTAEGKISDNVLWKTWQYIHKELIDQKVIVQRDVPTIEDYVVWDEEKDYCKVVIGVAVQ